MSETAHYKLYTSSDDTTKFKEFREKLAGDTDSNMMKIDSALKAHDDALAGKQDVIAGTAGQVVGFDASGNAVAQEAPDIGVKSFNGRTGAVTSQDGDYTAEQVGARPSTWVPTAADVGALSTGGGTVSGDTTIKTDSGTQIMIADLYGTGMIDLYSRSSTEYGARLQLMCTSKSSGIKASIFGANADGTSNNMILGPDGLTMNFPDPTLDNHVVTKKYVDSTTKPSVWKPFYAGTSAPSDTNQLWIDTTANTGGLKYWNGSAWVAVPVAYT